MRYWFFVLALWVGPAWGAEVTVNLNPGWNAVGFRYPRLTRLTPSPLITGCARYSSSGYTLGSFTLENLEGREAVFVYATSSTSFSYDGTFEGAGLDLPSGGYHLVSLWTTFDTSSVTLFEIGPDNVSRPVSGSQPGRAYWVFTRGPVRLSPAPAVTTLRLSPPEATVNLFSTIRFTLTATLPDGSERDVTELATWNSTDPSVAAVLAPGLLKGLNPFATSVTAGLSGITARASLRVLDLAGPPGPAPAPSPATPSRIFVTSANASPKVVRMDDMAGANNVSQDLGGSLLSPWGIFVDNKRRLYLADSSNGIRRMDDMSGANLVSFSAGLNLPRGVWVDGSDRIYVADTFNNRVVRMDDMSGANLISQDLTASGLGFSRPNAICLDGSGRIYVADRLRSRIVRMDDMSGANNVTLPFNQPNGLCLDTVGRIYVAETALNRIVRIDDMTGLNTVTQDLAASGTPFNTPSGIHVDPAGRIYVADFANTRVVRMDDMTGANNVSQSLSGQPSQLSGPRGVFFR